MIATDDTGEGLISIRSLADDMTRVHALDEVGMDKVELKTCGNAVEKRMVSIEMDRVPSNLRDLQGRVFKRKLPALPWY